jgi:hypothetical protein
MPATDHGADRDREPCDAAPGPKNRAALLAWRLTGEDRERERSDDRRAQALDAARRDQHPGPVGERRQHRAQGEDGHPDHEHALAAEPVAERSTREEQHGERQRVGVDDPLEALERRPQVRLDAGEGRDHDEVVQCRHEQRDRRDSKCPCELVRHRVPPVWLGAYFRTKGRTR